MGRVETIIPLNQTASYEPVTEDLLAYARRADDKNR